MFLEHLRINNFKNLDQKEFTFSKINCIVGNNGVGKTNILDAIYYLSFCKSFSSTNDLNTIRYNEDYFALFGTYLLKDGQQEVFCCSQKKGQKKVLKHGKTLYKRLSEHIGKLPCVMVSPNDQIYILGQSEVRRKFVDMILSQTDNIYLENLIAYNRCLEQRNKLLKFFQQNGYFDDIQLSIWTEQLCTHAKIIQDKRRQFFAEFIEPFQKYYTFISCQKEVATMQYKTYDGELIDILHQNQEKEKILTYTSQGVHKDDIVFLLDGHNVQHSGSQGQQKTFVLAMKLAQYEYLKAKNGHNPILLLDDIFDKFDFSRVEKILSLVTTEDFGQVFLTDTHLDRVESIIPADKNDITTIIKITASQP